MTDSWGAECSATVSVGHNVTFSAAGKTGASWSRHSDVNMGGVLRFVPGRHCQRAHIAHALLATNCVCTNGMYLLTVHERW